VKVGDSEPTYSDRPRLGPHERSRARRGRKFGPTLLTNGDLAPRTKPGRRGYAHENAILIPCSPGHVRTSRKSLPRCGICLVR